MKTILIVPLISFSVSLIAQTVPVFTTKDGAIKGYDPVSYFLNEKAQKGNPELIYEWNEATWHFSSQKNRNTFIANPVKFAPQFGGYCAYAVSQGYTYATNPEAWKIVNGKLYLNYSKNIQKKWENNQSEFIRLGELKWPMLIE